MEIIEIVEQEVKRLECEFQESQGLILTEDDLKCHLFRKLYPHFGHALTTMDQNIKAGPLHAEVNFFNRFNVLRKRPDLVIFNPQSLSILHSVEYEIDKVGIKYKYPTSEKQFEFGGNSIIFELKFCRNRKGIIKSSIDSYKKDIEKIRELQSITKDRSNGTNKITGIFIVFNKTDKKPIAFDDLFDLQDDSLKIFYGTGKVIISENDYYVHKFDSLRTED